jgi:hypothetical protein
VSLVFSTFYCLLTLADYPLYSSKPIRRPQLKKVLKEYCAPIPEENEEPTPPEPPLSRPESASTTIVVLNQPMMESSSVENANGIPKPDDLRGRTKELRHENQQNEANVSPHTKN